MAGRRPLPTKLKLLLNKKRINKNEPTPEAGTPEIPEWLHEFPAAIKEWEYESGQLIAMGVLTMADPNEFAWRCYLSSQLQELAKDIKKEGRTVLPIIKLDDDGEPVYGTAKTNPKCIQLAALLTEYRQTGSLYGLDPASRSKLKATPTNEPDGIEAFRNRHKKGK